MNHIDEAACRRRLEDLWAYWPQAREVPPALADAARACPACQAEFEEFKSWCGRASLPTGAPLSWSAVLSASRWQRLARATQEALRAAPRAQPTVWVSTLAFAAAVALLAVIFRPPPHGAFAPRPPLAAPRGVAPAPTAAAPAPPDEVLDNPEFFEKLELLEDLDAVRVAEQRKAL